MAKLNLLASELTQEPEVASKLESTIPNGEAVSRGPVDSNEGPSPEQRKPTRLSPVTDGPDVGPLGNYKPAAYPIGNIGAIREDR